MSTTKTAVRYSLKDMREQMRHLESLLKSGDWTDVLQAANELAAQAVTLESDIEEMIR